MLNILKSVKNFFKNSDNEVEDFLDEANAKCKKLSLELLKDFDLCSYQYDINKSIKELGLEKELIEQLIEEFISQVINNKPLFIEYIDKIKQAQLNGKNPNFTPLRDLAHKNLGVARNLDIDDAQKILYELKTNDSIECLTLFVELLEVSVIRLNPSYTYKIINKN